jgi:nucleotide-binding universal stress UspA family protein
MKSIVAAFDGSPSAERAVAFGADLARSQAASLVVVCVGEITTGRDLEECKDRKWHDR